jgi:uncharacterized protein (TIGR03382 family)
MGPGLPEEPSPAPWEGGATWWRTLRAGLTGRHHGKQCRSPFVVGAQTDERTHCLKHLLSLAPFVLVPTLASAAIVWKGDFETGNLSQWDRTQSVASNRLLVVSDVVREGRYALRAMVRKGDDPIKASGNRNELLYMGLEPSGSEYYYKWSTLFPQNFPRSSKWQIFTQWHHEGLNGSPPLELYVVDDELRMRVGGTSGQVVWRAPLQREKWNDFVLRVKWSSDPKVGFVEMYHDGKLVVPLRRMATQYKGERNYLKVGLYRDASISPEGVIFHDGFTMATELKDVMPVPPPAAVAAPTLAPTPVAAPEPVPEPVAAPAPAPAPVAAPEPIVQTPPFLPDTSEAPGLLVPQDPMLGTMGPAGCGASATGGTPFLVGAAFGLLALLSRRKPAHAPVRSGPRR